MTAVVPCARCGTQMPAPTGRTARKRYCSDPCRKAAWRDRHHNHDHAPDTVPTVVADIVPGLHDGIVVPTPSRDDVATPGSQHRCPHCRQPLAIISVLIPADAAVVSLPEAPMNPGRPLDSERADPGKMT